MSEIFQFAYYESFLYKPTNLNEPSFVNGKNEAKEMMVLSEASRIFIIKKINIYLKS